MAVIGIAAMSVAAACAGSAPPSGAATGTHLTIGAVLTMTGSGAFYGKDQYAALKMAVDEVNKTGGIKGHPIDLVMEDSASDNTQAISAFNKVLEKTPVAVIGPVFGTEMLAMQPTIDKEGVPTATISGTRAVTQKGSPNLFRTDSHDGVIKVALTKYILDKLHYTKIGLIITNDAWGFSGRDVITAMLKDRGLAPVGVEQHAASATNMTAQLLNLKKAGAEIIVTQGYTPDTGIIMKQAHDLNLGVPIFTSTDGELAAILDITTAADVNGIYAAGLVMPERTDDPKVKAWATKFQQAQGFTPNLYGLVQYDGIQTVFAAMRQYGVTRDEIRKGMKQVTYQGFNGTFHSDAEGNMLSTCQIIRFGSDKSAKLLEAVIVPVSEQK